MGLMPYVRPTFDDANSVLATGHQLFFYIAGTTTKQDTFTDATLAVANPNPIKLNARGEPDNAGSPIDVYFTPGLSYKVVYTTDTDTDPPTTPIWTVDNVTDSGGGGASAGGQWLDADTAVYVNATTFNITGIDVTTDYHKGRRVWLSGSVERYATIFSSSFAANTSVVCVDIKDAAGAASVLNAGMTSSALSIQRVDPDKAIHYRFYPGTEAGVTNYEFPIGDLRRYGALMDGVDDSAAYVSCIAAVPSGGTLYVPDGVAVIQTTTITKPIHVQGIGTLKLQANSNVDFITLGVGSDGTKITDITIDANKAAQTTDGIALTTTVGDIHVEGTHILNGSEGITVTGVNSINTQILNNHIDNCDYDIFVKDGTEVTILGNIVLGYSFIGIAIDNITTNISENIIISSNYITNKNAAAAGGTGIVISSSNQVIVSNNIIDSSKTSGIDVGRAGGDPIPSGFNITGNIIKEPTTDGIFLGECDFGIVSNNSIFTNGISDRGIYALGTGAPGTVTSTIIEGNTIGATTIAGIDNTGGATIGENIINTVGLRTSNLNFGLNAGLTSLYGISTSSTPSTNFQGIATWPGAANASNLVVFSTPEPDTNYEIIFVERNNSTLDGVVLRVSSKTVNGFSAFAVGALPAAGTDIGWVVIRVIAAHT